MAKPLSLFVGDIESQEGGSGKRKAERFWAVDSEEAGFYFPILDGKLDPSPRTCRLRGMAFLSNHNLSVDRI